MKTQSTRNLNKNRDIFPAPSKESSGKKVSRVMTADKPQTFLTKGKKPRPETAKLRKPEDLTVTEQQDEGIDLQKILGFYRDRVEAHEKDRFAYLQKMDKLRLKQDKAHKLEWELKKRTDERQELEQALQQCQDKLGSERGLIEEMSEGGE